MKRICLFLCLALVLLCPNLAARVVDVTRFGAKGDGKSLCNSAFVKAITKVAAGDTLLVPRGKFLVSSVRLKSQMTLWLSEGAELIAASDPERYESLTLGEVCRRYDTGAGTRNANLTSDARWMRGMILVSGAHDVTIAGHGTIDGGHIEDPLGEEGMRGPHTILIGESQNVQVRDITVKRASNYAILGFELADTRFVNLHITEGWDGIHVRDGNNILIDSCDIRTGDDAIAGGYWKGMEIRNSYLNSSCNGIRIIQPCDGVEIHHISVKGPGEYPHRTSREAHRTGTIYGIVIEPGGWGSAPGEVRGIYVHDVVMDKMFGPMCYSMGADNVCRDLTVENLKATNVTVTQPLNRIGTDRMWQKVEMRNVSVEAAKD